MADCTTQKRIRRRTKKEREIMEKVLVPKEILEKEILYDKVGKNIVTITFNNPAKLNALSFAHYQHLAWLLEKADADPDSVITVILGSGKYFSAGADIERNIAAFGSDFPSKEDTRSYWLKGFLANNTYFTKAIYSHRKVLVCGLNGSVIGLSAAMVALADLVYAKSEKFYMLLPFANLSLVTEGSAATTLFNRLGVSKANEALLLSRPIKGQELVQVGFVNRVYNAASTEEFNKKLVSDLSEYVENLDKESVLSIKQLIQNNWKKQLVESNFLEATIGLTRFEKGEPQERFRKLRDKEMKHKL